jgi:integrase
MARSKGPNGRGTIFQDKHGVWWAQLPADEFGKRPKARAETEAGAVEQLIALERKRARRLNLSDSRQTLAQFLRVWLEDVVRPEVKPSTAADYTYIVDRYIIPHLGRIRLCDLGVAHVRRWLNTLRTQKVIIKTKKKPQGEPRVLSASTIHSAYGRLRTALGVALLERLVIENVAALVEPPEVEPREMHPFTAGQARTLLSEVASDRLYTLYLIELTLGLRMGELLGLRWVDLDWAAGTLKITQQVRLVKNAVTITSPKTKKSRRLLPLNEDILVALRLRYQQYLEERQLPDHQWEEHGLIFPSEVGTPINPRNMLRAFKRLLKRAKLPNIRFHDLRHTAASLMLASGAPITDVGEILGHSSPAITARVYAHAYEEGKRTAVETMGRLLRKVEV